MFESLRNGMVLLRSSVVQIQYRNNSLWEPNLVFAKTAPKVIYSEADADRIYGDSQLAQKLKDSFKYLSKLNKIPGVSTGDLLFTDDKDSRLVNNEQCVTFQPNTIVYAIPCFK